MYDALYSIKSFKLANKITKFRYQLNPVPGGSVSEEARLLCLASGEIIIVRVLCSSPNYTFSLRSKQGATSPTLDEIYRSEEIEYRYDDTSIGMVYVNEDDPEANYLYVVITNVSATPTGPIWVELTVSRM